MEIKNKDQLIEKVEHIGFLYSKQTNLILELVGSMRKYKKTKTLNQWKEEVEKVLNLESIKGGKN